MIWNAPPIARRLPVRVRPRPSFYLSPRPAMTELLAFAHAHPYLAFLFLAMGLSFVYEMTKLLLAWVSDWTS